MYSLLLAPVRRWVVCSFSISGSGCLIGECGRGMGRRDCLRGCADDWVSCLSLLVPHTVLSSDILVIEGVEQSAPHEVNGVNGTLYL